MSANELFKELKESLSLKEIAEKLELHTGTLKRWENLKKVPDEYKHDLNFLLGNKYTLEKENYRSHNEFFTKKESAKYCYKKLMDFLNQHSIDVGEYVFIEPSCGDLSFYDLMPKNSRIGIDLTYKNKEILCENFLNFTPKKEGKYLILGNPPFGLRGNLALRFINHAYHFADFIAFILPPLFDSDGKGSPKKRVRGYTLAYSEKLPLNSFIYPNGKEVEVATLFQIWVKNTLLEQNILKFKAKKAKTCKNFIKIYSLSDGGTPSSTRNKAMLYKCDLYLPSTCFHSKNKPQMKSYENFESLPHRRGYGVVILKDKEKVLKTLKQTDWTKLSFLGTNSSLNLRSSLIEKALIEQGIYDESETNGKAILNILK
ncbi:restriction endonuclease subunit M [Campylobacter upsaliensis]|nr:restriction endonuclease subunit M [Campylobacter upsaliensis]EGL3838448.1 restriction endonuclease subunit M [Campylobacter upsaliensis]